jgi:putative ABC transport system ATP-binding protein
MALRQPILRGRGLIRTFGGDGPVITVLRDVVIDLDRGELVLLQGPSGSGKSTLLAVLSGLLPPTHGKVQALGHDLWGLTALERERFRRRHYGFIFQNYNLLPALTARQQLEVVLRWAEGVPAREARARSERMLGVLGLGRKGHLRPTQLSGGEKQRVAIGRALVMGPALCFADEPTSALDWANGEGVIELLRAAARQDGATSLVVSHDARLIPYADRVLHMEDGRLTEPGEPAARQPRGEEATSIPS